MNKSKWSIFWHKLTVGDEKQAPWASNPAVVFASLFFLFPVGLWFLFRFTDWGTKTKVALTVIAFLVVGSRMPSTEAIREAARRSNQPALAPPAQLSQAQAEIQPQAKKGEYELGSFTVENKIQDEIELSDLEYDGWDLTFTLYWHTNVSSAKTDPWKFSVYDKNNVKLHGGVVDFPRSISLGTKVQSTNFIGGDKVSSKAARVVIHR